MHEEIYLVSPVYYKRLPHLSNPVFEYSLVYASLLLAIILHGYWHHIESPGHPPIRLSLKNYQRSELLTIQSNPGSTVHHIEIPVVFRDTVLSPLLARVNPLSISKKIFAKSMLTTHCQLY
jgi:hypothetical protein